MACHMCVCGNPVRWAYLYGNVAGHDALRGFAATEPKSAEILIALLKGPLKSGFQSMLQKKLYGALSTTLNEVRSFARVARPVPDL